MVRAMPEESVPGLRAQEGEALCMAAAGGHTACISTLLAAGCAVDVQDGEPLIRAAAHGHLQVRARLLVYEGVGVMDVGVGVRNGEAPDPSCCARAPAGQRKQGVAPWGCP